MKTIQIYRHLFFRIFDYFYKRIVRVIIYFRCLVISDEDERKSYKHYLDVKLLKKTITRLQQAEHLIYFKRYDRHIIRIKKQILINPDYRVRVLFLISETSKWNVQSVYDALCNSGRFEPFVVVVPPCFLGGDAHHFEDNTDMLYDFFKRKNIPVFKGYDSQTNSYIRLKTFQPDIIFYEQPWLIYKFNRPHYTASYALTCYVPYGLTIANFHDRHYQLSFQACTWKIFTENSIHHYYYRKYSLFKGENTVLTGHPKLDVYLQNKKIDGTKIWKVSKTDNHSTKRIIYAPHHSFEPIENTAKTFLRYATFQWNGMFMLEYAKKHLDVEWIIKPHPWFKFKAIKFNIMTEEEVEQYFKEWNELPNANVFTDGDYFDMFSTSDAMITDCGSFLAEYLYTKKPILHLISEHSIGYNKVGRMMIKDYYKASNTDEINDFIEEVVLKENDYLYDERIKALQVFPIPQEGAGNLIVRELENVFSINK